MSHISALMRISRTVIRKKRVAYSESINGENDERLPRNKMSLISASPVIMLFC